MPRIHSTELHLHPERAPAGAKVRAVAAELVARVIDERIAVDDLLPARGIAARDQPLLAALVYGALRWHHRLEWQCGRLLTRPLQKSETELAALLRIGILQLEELRIPAHAAVSATVDAVTLLGSRHAAGLVNAVLRRFQREREQLTRAEAQPLEARFSHPQWIIEALRRDYPQHWAAILDANNAPPPMWLRVNALRTTRAEYLAKLEQSGMKGTAGDVDSAVRLEEPVTVAALPGFAAGEVSVQDLSAQRAAQLLDLKAGQRVLDACAAPGGKTGHILEIAAGQCEVWAVERDPARLTMVRENLERLGVSARLVAGDATAPKDWWDGTPFDRILLDAPCSALGVIRRHPDIKLLRRPADVDRVVALQAKMLGALWPLVAPGGLLLYATCTLLKRENDQQIEAFRSLEPTIDPEPTSTTRCQLLTGEAEGDGFYYAWLRKPHVSRTLSGVSPQP
ncbi:MAG TPA: 16S rRNA (cytosine(967)-C(5))-methyltransferase RsmB [Gammaproteobacteria bacterium]